MDILALDLGTHTGFAYNRGTVFACGTWKLATPQEVTAWGKQRLTRTDDPRIERLCENMSISGVFDIVVFEDVQFASSVYAVQLWSSFRAAVWLCANVSTHIDCVPVGTLKKFATGNGTADKPMMSRALKQEHPEKWNKNLTDDEVDAIWLHIWATQRFKRMKI